jgi:hypothetical protein
MCLGPISYGGVKLVPLGKKLFVPVNNASRKENISTCLWCMGIAAVWYDVGTR